MTLLIAESTEAVFPVFWAVFWAFQNCGTALVLGHEDTCERKAARSEWAGARTFNSTAYFAVTRCCSLAQLADAAEIRSLFRSRVRDSGCLCLAQVADFQIQQTKATETDDERGTSYTINGIQTRRYRIALG